MCSTYIACSTYVQMCDIWALSIPSRHFQRLCCLVRGPRVSTSQIFRRVVERSGISDTTACLDDTASPVVSRGFNASAGFLVNGVLVTNKQTNNAVIARNAPSFVLNIQKPEVCVQSCMHQELCLTDLYLPQISACSSVPEH